MTIQTTGTAPLQLGQSRSFAAGPIHLLTVSRAAAGYVVTATRDGHDLPCYASVFGVANVPADMTPRVAAFTYMKGLYDEFVAEVPAQVAPVPVIPAGQKVTIKVNVTDPLYRVMQAASINGWTIRLPMRGVAVTQLRALAKMGLADLLYRAGTTRITGATLNGAGRRQYDTEAAKRRSQTTASQYAA